MGFCFFWYRIQNDAKGVLAPVSVKLDKNNKVTVLYPKMSSDLFDRFTGHPDNLILLRDGLRIVQQMIEALESCWDRGLHHIDLRLTNVMVFLLVLIIVRLFNKFDLLIDDFSLD